MTNVLLARDLVKDFGGFRAVDGVSLELSAGERVALLGPNGAGKTTTLLMLLGAIDPDRGTIELVGQLLPRHRSRAMRQVGFVAGYLPRPQHLLVVEALEYFAGLYGMRKPRAAIADAMDRFEIGHLAGRRCEQLSSGQRTLVGVCKAVLARPALVVLDEPTASLDPDIAHRAREGLRSLSVDEGTALLVTSHHMLEVERLCPRVAFMAAGRIVADGSPSEVAASFDQADLEGVFLELAGTHRREEGAP